MFGDQPNEQQTLKFNKLTELVYHTPFSGQIPQTVDNLTFSELKSSVNIQLNNPVARKGLPAIHRYEETTGASPHSIMRVGRYFLEVVSRKPLWISSNGAFMYMFNKPKIYEQINEYVLWKERIYGGAYKDKVYLTKFVLGTNVKDVYEISDQDIKNFKDEILVSFRTTSEFQNAMIAVRGIMRYYKTKSTRVFQENLKLARI